MPLDRLLSMSMIRSALLRLDPTLAYLKLAGDLQSHFGNLDGYSIVEIGAGYGGLCKIIFDVHKPSCYTIIDTPENLELARALLKAQGIEGVRFLAFEELKGNERFDLTISHFGFSEMGKALQDHCLNKVFVFCKNGFLLCNESPSTRILAKNRKDLGACI